MHRKQITDIIVHQSFMQWWGRLAGVARSRAEMEKGSRKGCLWVGPDGIPAWLMSVGHGISDTLIMSVLWGFPWVYTDLYLFVPIYFVTE